MADVQFDEDQGLAGGSFRSRQILGQPVTPAMVRLLVRTGVVKNEQTASYVLVALFICAFVASIIVFMWNGGVGRSAPKPMPVGQIPGAGAPVLR